MSHANPGARARARGFTFVELLIALSIACALLGIGIPGMKDFLATSRANSYMMELHGLLESARQAAIVDAVDVTLCGTSDGTRCSASWRNQPTLVFVDRNLDRIADNGDTVLLVSTLTKSGAIDWRGSAGRNYLRFRSNGGVKEFGTFYYCPPDANPRQARALIVSATGRPRATADTNGDGIREDPGGQPLDCSGF